MHLWNNNFHADDVTLCIQGDGKENRIQSYLENITTFQSVRCKE
jgi:hypothetical protein